MRRITKPLALLLALVMVIGLLPMMAFAVDGTEASVTITVPTADWNTCSGQSDAATLRFGKSGNKVKIWTDGVGINISDITVGGVAKKLTAEAVEVSGAQWNDGGVIGNLHIAGSYAVIDLDALGFGDLTGEQTVSFAYATTEGSVNLHMSSSYDEEQPEPSTEPSTEPTEPPAAGYQKVTVTGIEATGDWDATDTTYQNWFTIPGMQLDPNGTLTIRGNGRGINVSAIEIGGKKLTVTQLNSSGAVTINGTDSSGNAVNLEQKGSEYQIAHLELPDVSATINLSGFGIAAGAYSIKFYYAISGNAADLIVESSVGAGETTAAYDSISHGTLGGSVTPPSGEGHTTPARRGITENDQTNPSKAVWFFDSHGETKSFNQTNDTYEDELKSGLHNNDLILYASTDGAIQNTGTGGELRINWENQNRTAPVDVGSRGLMGSGYTDGSYTVVGWGGEFEGGSDKAKNAIRFTIKDGGDGTLSDALTHMTVYLVDQYGEIKDKIWVKDAQGADTSVDSLHYVRTTDDGYHIFEATLNGDSTIQGIKLAFDRYSQSGSFAEDANTHHSGTLVIGEVQIRVNENWVDFGPFDYHDGDGNYENPYKSPVTSGSRPFLRSAHYKSTLQQGAHEGYNLANKQDGYDWHIWTMSSSDANIVNNAYSNADALQIKYSSTPQHVTYTHLVGNRELNGEWLVMTLGGEVDANTRFRLVNSSAANTADDKDFSATLSLSDFRTAKDDSAEAVTAELFNDNHYHTIYYHMKGETFKSVYVDFANVYDEPGDASRYMYITEIYLLEPAAKIEKAVDKEEASTGDELTYTLTVTNNDEQPISQFTVTDELPEGVSFVSSDPATVLGADGRTVTWYYSGEAFTMGQSKVLTVTVKVNVGFQGTLVNSGTITSLNNKTQAIGSNHVSTVVTAKTPEEFVFYAEVNQKTTLPISLGSTANTTTTTGTVEKTAASVRLSYASGYGDNDYATASATVKLDSDGSIKITTDADGGISLRRIRLNGSNILWMESKQTKTADNVTVTGAGHFGSDGQFAEGEINNLKNGSIVISGLTAGDYTVEFQYRSWNNPSMDLKTVTQETTTVTGEPTPDTVAAVPANSKDNAIEANGIVGQNSGSLLYTSRATGKDTFELTYNPGGDTTKTQTAKVTVYNYKVDNHVYVLDYGLSVNLTDGKSGFLRNATLSLEGDNAGYAFTGLSDVRRNADSVADTGDYATPYGGKTLERSNGRADWNGMPDLESLSVTFTPTTFMSSIDTFYYGVQVSKNDTTPSDATNATPVMEGEIKVMPANVVYYEDNFSHSGTDSADGTNGIIYTGANSAGNAEDTFHWQTNDQDSVYGYDEDAYKDAVGDYSNGNAHELSISATASFTFKGTGFDIVGRTNDRTGILRAMIYSVDEAGKTTFEKFIIVDTYYENGDLYQIPVISVLNLPYGTHKVVLSSMRGYADEYAGKTSTVYIDGVRIYNPLGEQGDPAYGEEQGAAFMEVKSMIFGSNFNYDRDVPQNSTWTDGEPADVMATLVKFDKVNKMYLNGSTLVEVLKNRNNADETVETAPGSTYDLLTYAFSGPNKELYLEDGYGIGFAPDGSGLLQIGVKLISKPANTYPTIQYLDSDGGWKTLCVVDSSTEKYYSLEEIVASGDIYDDALTLKVSGPGIVSLTNLKSRGYEFWPVATEADNNDDPVQMITLKQEDMKVISGYRNGKFAAGLINIRVTTKVADDITAVKVFDVDGNEIVLQSMTFKDNGETRTWTIKFKAKAAAENYQVQVFNSAGNYSNQVNVK